MDATNESLSGLNLSSTEKSEEKPWDDHETHIKANREFQEKMKGAGPDTPTLTSENGAKQSDIPYRFDLIDGLAMAEMAKVLKDGAEKYGQDNWRGIDVPSHLNHLLMHTFAWLAGDRSDDHLSHILCRATFAVAVSVSSDMEEPF